jgi:ferredoxin--NADP+ reductase/benzoate/toluate 1,2-dioxygenase reductase subunit
MQKIEIKGMVQPWQVIEVRELTEATYVLLFNKNGMEFKPGQHLLLGIANSEEAREYSIYSGAKEEFLEILVREVEDGKVSKQLRKLPPGSKLNVNGPYGFFMYNTLPPSFKNLVFIASGTGIAPFHSFAKTFPDANYHIIHGIRTIEEAYDRSDYGSGCYTACTSRDESGHFPGRLTSYLKDANIPKDAMIYFCGNSSMILESMEILQERGYSQSQMFTEVYF